MDRMLRGRQRHVCDKDKTTAAMQEMARYCERHPGGPVAIRQPKLSVRGSNYIVLLGDSVPTGIVGLGRTVPAALRAFEDQYLRIIRPRETSL